MADRMAVDVTATGRDRVFIGRRKKQKVSIGFQAFTINGVNVGDIRGETHWDKASDLYLTLPAVNLQIQAVSASGSSSGGSGRGCSGGCSSGCSGSS